MSGECDKCGESAVDVYCLLEDFLNANKHIEKSRITAAMFAHIAENYLYSGTSYKDYEKSMNDTAKIYKCLWEQNDSINA